MPKVISISSEMSKMHDIMNEDKIAEKQKIYILKYNKIGIDRVILAGFEIIGVRAKDSVIAKFIGDEYFKGRSDIKFHDFICDSSEVTFQFYSDIPVINVNQNGVNK